ncbi:S1 family peptidase [Candidatus Electronema sp. JM]|uniref:S1 family peptidase n=1 Tax=Candidatus Electronema sp. JM TaxID=3401571 RepID=UPI003AA7EC61
MNLLRHAAAFSFIITLTAAGMLRAENNVTFLDKELIKKLSHGIYEVVTPKLESEKIEYDRKLPFDKLDFKERNEKYYSIGTAFFISDKELMTAGHVFSPMHFTLQKNYFIRDSEGKVYPVGAIRSYSTVRDMLVFDLQQYPSEITPLNYSRKVPEIGDTVFSAGNALGEGISYRAGQVASFTDEHEYGLWKNIRFSSPASPGNSGGPLLTVAGEVAGVIVQRANTGENYNIAVPIAEAANLAHDKAEFQLRNVTVELAGTDETAVKDWIFSLPLPAPLADVAEKSQNALDEFYKKLSNELTEKVKDKNFPQGERFRHMLRNQQIAQGFAALVPNTDFQKWDMIGYSMDKLPISAEQNVWRGESLHFALQALIEKAPKTPLKTFLDSPKLLMDTLLKAVPYYRYVGKEKVRIISFGEPDQRSAWTDRLGRKWSYYLWFSPHNNTFLTMHCLPHPKGSLCNVTAKSASSLKLNYFDILKESTDEMSVGYEGDVDDWTEYLALGEHYLPAFFKNAAIAKDGDGSNLKVQLKNFRFAFSNPKISGKSSVHLHLGYANDQLLAEDLVLFELFPQKGSPAEYTIWPLFEASPFSQESYAANWGEAASGAGEYSGKVMDKDDRRVIQHIAPQTKKTLTAFDGKKIERIFAVGCAYKTGTDETSGIEQDCQHFLQAIQFN